MKVIVIGANGQLGSDICDVLTNNYEVVPINHHQLDIQNLSAINSLIQSLKPDILINTAAFHQVELCEQEEEKARLINAVAPSYMAKICKENHIKFVHFSTDYVFDGKKKSPYVETDLPLALNIYGITKHEGENLILELNHQAIVVRVSAIYGTNPCRAKNGLNFVKLMLKIANEKGEVKVVDDEFVSPTYTIDIAKQLVVILENDVHGLIHATSEGECSWFQFADEIFKYTHTKVNLISVSSDEFPAKVCRPKYSVLENEILKSLKLNIMPHWKISLHQYLDTFGQSI